MRISSGDWPEKFKSLDRPELAKALDHMRKGDVLVVWKLFRLARPAHATWVGFGRPRKAGSKLLFLAPSIDTSPPRPVAAFHHRGIRPNSSGKSSSSGPKPALKAALARGRKGGRPKPSATKTWPTPELFCRDPLISVAASRPALFGVSRTTIYTYLPEARTRAQRRGVAWSCQRVRRPFRSMAHLLGFARVIRCHCL